MILNSNDVEEKKETEARRENQETGSYNTCESNILLFTLSPPRNRKYARRENDGVDVMTPLVVAPVFATPTSPITIAWGLTSWGGARPLALGK